MKERSFSLYWVLALGIFICFTQTTALAQVSIVGEWLINITGKEKGGAVLTIDDSTFTGYSFIANKGYAYPVSGQYGSIDSRRRFSGHFDAPVPEDFTGKVAKNGTLTLTLKGRKYKGVPLPMEDPAIPENWTVKVAGVKKPYNTFNTFAIWPQESHRIFEFSGSGFFGQLGTINVSGSFFVTSKNAVYGVYTVSEGIAQTGFLSGTIKPSTGKLKFKLVNNEGKKSILTGTAIQPQ